MQQEQQNNSGEYLIREKRTSFLDEHGAKITAGLLTAFVLGAMGWAITMDRQSVEITITLKQIQKQLDNQTSKLNELNQLEKRVTRIEDTRFTGDDARQLAEKCDAIEGRLRTLEDNARRRRR